jgi:hypothetical protein
VFQNRSLPRRILSRVGIGIGAAAAAILAMPGIAQAHVTVQPGTAQGGGFSVIAFRVPNERDGATTTQVRISLPEDQPIGSVKTTPVPGWKITTSTRHLDKPFEMFGEQLDTVSPMSPGQPPPGVSAQANSRTSTSAWASSPSPVSSCSTPFRPTPVAKR